MADVNLHPLALVDPSAVLGDGVTVGPYSTIAGDVVIGAGTHVASSVQIEPYTRIGSNCRVFHGAVIGGLPQDLKFRGERTFCVVGESTVIREYVTVHRGTGEAGETRIGSSCLIMAYAHVAHDCRIGDRVILANAVNMAGHVTVEDQAVIGGLTAIHQFVRIGCHSLVGGASRIAQDILPYTRASGNPPRVAGINVTGLIRRGFTAETRAVLARAYRIIYRRGLNTSQAVERIRAELPPIPEIVRLLGFIETSTRGLTK